MVEKAAPGVGERIRTIRKAKKVTLLELAKVSGVAQASLSRIETGSMQGTVESHQRIAEALGINLAELYSDIDSRLQKTVRSEKKTRAVTSKKQNLISYEVLTHHASDKKIMPVLITLEQGAETDAERSDSGTDKFIWVIEGRVACTLEKETQTLAKGDTLYFDASVQHRLKHLAGSPAKILQVTSPAVL